PGKPSLHGFHIALVSQFEVGMAEPLAARQQTIRELFRLQMDVPFYLLKPFHAIPRCALQLERFQFALLLIPLQRRADIFIEWKVRGRARWHLPWPAWFQSQC